MKFYSIAGLLLTFTTFISCMYVPKYDIKLSKNQEIPSCFWIIVYKRIPRPVTPLPPPPPPPGIY